MITKLKFDKAAVALRADESSPYDGDIAARVGNTCAHHSLFVMYSVSPRVGGHCSPTPFPCVRGGCSRVVYRVCTV